MAVCLVVCFNDDIGSTGRFDTCLCFWHSLVLAESSLDDPFRIIERHVKPLSSTLQRGHLGSCFSIVVKCSDYPLLKGLWTGISLSEFR